MNGIVRWGVLGNAWIARDFVIPALEAAPNCEFAAIASRGRLEADVFKQAKHYAGYDLLLNDHEIDAVYVPLPNALHAEWSIRAMQKGKHVLCEKPMALNAAQCEGMIREAKANGVLLMEAFMYRYSERTSLLISILNSGELGAIRGMHCHFGYMLDWASPPRQDQALGGGSLYDVGCYCVDSMNLIMRQQGAAFADAGAVFSDCGGVDQHASGWLRYTNGVTGTFDCWFDACAHQELTLIGEKGVLRVPSPFHDVPAELYLTTDGGTRAMPVPQSRSYVKEVEAFADAVLQKENRLVPLSDTLATMNALDMLYSNRYTTRSTMTRGEKQ